jgi:hypothetical protein
MANKIKITEGQLKKIMANRINEQHEGDVEESAAGGVGLSKMMDLTDKLNSMTASYIRQVKEAISENGFGDYQEKYDELLSQLSDGLREGGDESDMGDTKKGLVQWPPLSNWDQEAYDKKQSELPTIVKAELTDIPAMRGIGEPIKLTLNNGRIVHISPGNLEGMFGGDANDLDSFVGTKWDDDDEMMNESIKKIKSEFNRFL